MLKKFSILILLMFNLFAFADGCYMPEQAIKNFPEITAQRAAISFKDGRETLIISSTLDSESQELGWIIPLPSVPDVMKKVEPGKLKTLSFLLQPEIIHDLLEYAILPLIIIWVALLFRANIFNNSTAITLLGTLGFCFVLLVLGAPVGGSIGSLPTSSIKEERTANVGAYRIKVISAKKADQINNWLESEKMGTFDEKGLEIISDYIAQKWCFAAIKLRRSDKGENTPHPIKFSFKTDKPVYPMKLTTLSDSKPYFELFVITKGKYTHPSLNIEYRDYFQLKKVNGSSDQERSVLKGNYFRAVLDRSRFGDIVFPGATVTKLSGSLAMDSVEDDLYFQKCSRKPVRQKLFSPKGKLWMGYYILTPFLVIFYVFFSDRQKKRGEGLDYFLVCFTKSTAIMFLLIFLLLLFFPSSGPISTEHPYRAWMGISTTKLVIKQCLDGNKESRWQYLNKDIEFPKETAVSEVHKILASALDNPRTEEVEVNPVTGKEFVNEATPGNFYVSKSKRGIKVEMVNLDGEMETLFDGKIQQ